MTAQCKKPLPLLEGENQHVFSHPSQKPLIITLDAAGLFLTAAALMLGIYLLPSNIMAMIMVSIPCCIYIHNDYANFISLGPGGTPSTFWGYLKILYLRIFALGNPLRPPKLYSSPNNHMASLGILKKANLEHRPGPRPKVAGIAPQRQLNQMGDTGCYHVLRRSLEYFAVAHPNKFAVAVSCFEKNGLALFARRPTRTTCGGEICHVHHSDRSLHLSLAPDDIAEVLDKGWGQRHPLARDQLWPPMPVPQEFVMIYAPRGRSCASNLPSSNSLMLVHLI